MNKTTSLPTSRSLLISIGSLMLLAGCATRPPRAPGPAQAPVMPPPVSGPEVLLPPPVEIEIAPVELPAAPSVTVAPVSVDPTVPVAAPAPRSGTPYTIKKGESLSAIAARNKMGWKKLAEYNRIAEPNKVRAGQVILIPETSAPAPSARRPAPPPPTANRGNTYVVQSGDNLTSIARKHNTTLDSLKGANDLRSDRLLVGQILKLPAGSSKPRSTVNRTEPKPQAPVTTIVRPAPTATPVPEPELEMDAEAPVGLEDPLVDKPFTIVVIEGDTLESIASNYVVSVEKIRELNNLPANATLTPGQKLEMPPGLY